MKIRTYKGFTLIELLVSMTILVLLCMLLLKVIQETLRVWRYAESKKILYNKSSTIRKNFKNDINSIFTKTDPSLNIKMILDFDKFNRQRIRFITRLKEEKNHPLLRYSGSNPSNKDYYGSKLGDKSKNIRATGGLAEVIYLITPNEKGTELWRGIRSPIGGKDSFFHDNNIESEDFVKLNCSLLSDNVLHFGIKCWTYNSFSWKTGKTINLPNTGEASVLWDSTRGQLVNFFLYKRGSFLHEKDDVFPCKIQLILFLRDNYARFSVLSDEIDDIAKKIPVKDIDLFNSLERSIVKINNELIFYKDISNNNLLITERAVLGTFSTSHKKNSIAYTGNMFISVFYLPTNFTPWF